MFSSLIFLCLVVGGKNVSHNANSWPHSQFPLHYAPSHYAHFNIFLFHFVGASVGERACVCVCVCASFSALIFFFHLLIKNEKKTFI